MQESTLLFILLVSIVVIALVAKRFNVPYPIAFVIGGTALAFVPNLPAFRLDPQWVFLIFLPPLLFAGGWTTDWQAFKDNLRPIGLLAIGLVFFTTAAVGIVAHALVPELGWAGAFVLGAVISPPDAVAAGAVFERFSVPRKILAILDGEGLVNDAVALVIYRFAIAAALTGTFSLAHASLAFGWVAAGGLAIGLAYGYVLCAATLMLKRFELSDHLIDNAISLIGPYAIYLSCEAAGVSGVLGTVAAGVYVSRKSDRIYSPDARIVLFALWEFMLFLLNGLVFLLIGLQVREIVRDPAFALGEIPIALAIAALVIVVRFVWVYPATYLPRLNRRVREREGVPGWEYTFVVGWSGMRGIVSLASALAVPLATASGAPFPGRDAIIFITFVTIFVTLVVQGLSLIPLLRILKIDAGETLGHREIEVRVAALQAGIARLRQLEPGFDSTEEWEVEGRILGEYEYRIAHLRGHIDGSIDPAAVAFDHRLQEEAIVAERREILRLRDAGEIPDEIFRTIQYDLDLANERLN